MTHKVFLVGISTIMGSELLRGQGWVGGWWWEKMNKVFILLCRL